MAKNKITIDIEVNGKMQKATVSAKKLRKALDTVDEAQQKVGKSARTADRNLKGTAQASSNSTKNFSKMAQGITGGLVPAYATLAANLFAVSAAFQFLKNASQVARLKEAQMDFTSSTGRALGYLTDRLQKASNGMLSFKEAAAATAIGTAKGFSSKQMEEMAQGAQKVSAALGRDFTDAFDRLLRGTSKAEPELLDELGITLRLEEATKRYGDAIGKNAKDLTTYERSQAVLKETMRQLNEQFGKNKASADPFVRLSKTFDKIITQISQSLLPLFTALANVLNEHAGLAIAAFGAFSYSVVASILDIDSLSDRLVDWETNTDRAATKASNSLDKYRKRLKLAQKTQKDFVEEGSGLLMFGAGEATKQGAKAGYLSKLQKGGYEGLNKLDQINLQRSLAAAEAQIANTGKVTKGVFKGVSATIITEMSKGLASVNTGLQATAAKSKSVWAKMGLHVQVWASWTRAKVASTVAYITSAFATLATRLGSIVVRGIFYAFIADLLYSLRADIVSAIDGLLEWTMEKIDQAFDTNLLDRYNKTTGAVLKGYVAEVKGLQEAAAYVRDFEESIKSLRDTAIALQGTPMSSEKWLNSLADIGTTFGDRYKELKENLKTDSAEFKKERALLADTMKLALPPLVYNRAIDAATAQGGNIFNFVKFFAKADEVGVAAGSARAELNSLNESIKNFDQNILKTGNLANYAQALEKISTQAAQTDKAFQNIEMLSKENVKGTDKTSEVSDRYSWLAPFIENYKALRVVNQDLINQEAELYDKRQRLVLLSDSQKRLQEIDLNISDKRLAVEQALLAQQEAKDALALKIKANEEGLLTVEQSVLDTLEDQVAQRTLAAQKAQTDLDVAEERAAVERKIANLQNSIDDGNRQLERLDIEKQITAEYSKRVGLLNTQSSIMLSQLEREREQAQRRIKGKWGIVDPKNVAKLDLAYAQKAAEIKKEAAKREYELKIAQLEVDSKTAQMRLNVAEMEMRAARARSGTAYTEGAAFSALRASMASTTALAKQTAGMQLQEAMDAADYEVLKAQQAVDDMSDASRYRRMFAEAFREGLEEGLDAFQDGNFGEAARKFALAFVEGFKQRLDEMLIDNIMYSIFGDEEAFRMEMAHVSGGAAAASQITTGMTTAGTGAAGEMLASMLEGGTTASAELLTTFTAGATEVGGAILTALTAGAGIIASAIGAANAASSSKGGLNILSAAANAISGGGGTNPLSGVGSAGVSALAQGLTKKQKTGGAALDAATGIPGLAVGGVVSGSTSGYPAILHGTEAVVPLGSGRSIPVELNGNSSAGPTNNVSVNVMMKENNADKVSASGDAVQAQQLGAAITAAVQKELAVQSRPGGLLSRG